MDSRNIFIFYFACLITSAWSTGTFRAGDTVRCNHRNRNPCLNFPGLCSEGRGACIVRGPCEYACVCPPNGTIDRDCIGNNPNPDNGAPANSLTFGAKSEGTLSDSLLVFPQDLFRDMNHVVKPGEVIRTTNQRDKSTTAPSSTTAAATDAIPATFTTTSKPNTRIELKPEARPLSQSEPSRLDAKKITTTKSTPTTTSSTGQISNINIPDPSSGVSDKSQLVASAMEAAAARSPSHKDSNTRLSSMSASNRGSIILNGLKSHGEGTGAAALSSSGLPVANQNHQDTTGAINKQTMENVRNVIPSIISGSSAGLGQNNQQIKDSSVAGSQLVIDTTPKSNNREGPTTQKSPAAVPTTTTSNTESSSKPADFRFPGHDNFPTFFGEAPPGPASNTDNNGNAPLSILVHQVFHPRDTFPTLRRRAH